MPKKKKARLATTAPKVPSIWANVGRQSFKENVCRLYNLDQKPAAPKVYPNLPTDDLLDGSLYVLPFDVEKELVDDVAFIADDKVGGETVTAASIRAVPNQEKLVLYLAANDGVSSNVQNELGKILQLLQACAQQKLKSEITKEQVFDIVIRLNKKKLLGRFGSTVIVPTSGRIKKPIAPGLQNLIEGKLKPHMRAETQEAFYKLKEEAALLSQAHQKVGKGTSSKQVNAIKEVIRVAYSITGQDFKLGSRLRDLGLSEEEAEKSRVVRVINKIANYWRICEVLVRMSRSYRGVFRNIQSTYLPRKMRYVHAEMQMLVHFELHPTTPQPRVIGVSKKACFLCDTFIHEHGVFYISKAHCRLYQNWNVPEDQPHTDETMRRINSSLLRTHAVVKQKLEAVKGYKKRRDSFAAPAESEVNLTPAVIPTPSVITALSSATPTVRSLSPLGQRANTPALLSNLHASPVDLEEKPASIREPSPKSSIAIEIASLAGAHSATHSLQTKTAETSKSPKPQHVEDVTSAILSQTGNTPAIKVTNFDFDELQHDDLNSADSLMSSHSMEPVDQRQFEEAPNDLLLDITPVDEQRALEINTKAPKPASDPPYRTLNWKTLHSHQRHFFIPMKSVSKPGYPGRVTTIESKAIRVEVMLQGSNEMEKPDTLKAGLASVTPLTNIEQGGDLRVVDVDEMEVGSERTLDNGGRALGSSTLILKIKGNEFVRIDCHWP